MALENLLRSGINNLQRTASSGIQSLDVNQFNQGLTRGLDQLGGSLGSAGGILEQAGSISSLVPRSISDIDIGSIGQGLSNRIGGALGNLDTVFQGKIESLSRANIISQSEGLTGSVTDIINSVPDSNISSLFSTGNLGSTLNGFSQNIAVLPQGFSSITTGLRDVASATTNLTSSVSSVTGFAAALQGGVQQALDSATTSGTGYDDAILRFLRLSPDSGGRADSNTNIQQVPSESGTGLRVKNPLREFASYNYILELGCLSPFELNSPEDTYRINLTNSIVRSGGGNYNNRTTTFNEDTLGKHAEYYIDNLEIDTVVSPNPNTGVTQGTNITFTVTEPYSMGQFLETLQIAATQSGYSNYIEAPYVIKIDFIGLDQDGNAKTGVASPPKFIPVKLTNIEFEVSGSGSEYECRAIPFNELGLTAQTATVRTDVSVSGNTVIEALEVGSTSPRGADSLSAVLNGRGQSLADAGVYNSPDRYIIMFPDDKQGATRAVNAAREADTGRQTGATRTISETQASQLSATELQLIRSAGTEVIPDGAVFDVLQRFARENINNIGRSPIIEDVNQDGDRTPSPHADAYDEETGTVNRAAASTQMDETTRSGNYTQGTSIISIIENIVLTSEWGRKLAEERGEEGLKEWFKIETQVFLETDPATQVTRGTPPKIYVYSVVPYFPDEAKFSAPSQRPENTRGLMELACKEYNYFYTGLNEDVLDFNIEFKTAFFQNLFADLGQHGSALRTGGSGETVTPGELSFTEVAPPGIGPVSNGQLSEPSAPLNETTSSTDSANGGIRHSASTATKAYIAQQFHDSLINSNVDMVNAEMEIWGDPYFLPTSGSGNYNAPSGGRPMLTADGTMDMQNSEVFVVVNFRTPFDYNVRTGAMQFSNLVKPFSGLYSITTARSSFSRGQYKNTLKMIRRRGQNDEATGDNDAIRLGNNQVISSQNNTPTTGADTAGQPNNSGVAAAPGGASSPPNTNGESRPTTGGGQLATIRTSIRGLETQVAALVAPNLQGLIDELENEYGYEIRSLGGYVDRYIAGTNRKSWHASGIAIDINPYPDNADGSVLTTNLPQPPNGSEMVALASKYGLGWGGAWTGGYIDAMHFSAARNEQGTYEVQRGVIPAAPPETTPAPDTSGTGTATSGGITGDGLRG